MQVRSTHKRLLHNIVYATKEESSPLVYRALLDQGPDQERPNPCSFDFAMERQD
jgi:hypothetical protein